MICFLSRNFFHFSEEVKQWNCWCILKESILIWSDGQSSKRRIQSISFSVSGHQKVCLSKEFRCFVYNNALTAISQYDNVCYFPELPGNAEKYKNIIESYFNEKLKLRLESFATYVVDIAILHNDTPIVIELNPYRSGHVKLFHHTFLWTLGASDQPIHDAFAFL